MAKKKPTNPVPTNKYGLASLNFGRPGFSLESPRTSLVAEEKKVETPSKKTTAKKPATKKATKGTEKKASTEKVIPTKQGQKFNKTSHVISKPAIRRAAGRGK